MPADYNLPAREVALLLEEGGYSGPQLFERTVALTRRYRTLLDEGIGENSETPTQAGEQSKTTDSSREDLSSRIEETIARDAANLKPDTPEAEASSKSQPLIRLPARNNPFSSDDSPSTPETPALSASHHLDQLPSSPTPKRKVIFATGGITNGRSPCKSVQFSILLIWLFQGRQALEVLKAGADVSQVRSNEKRGSSRK